MLVDKKLAAKEQLLTAIRLFFEDKSPISVHTLVGAALEICNNLVESKDAVIVNNLILHRQSFFIKNERRKEFNDAVNKYRNYFKHADRDKDAIVEFNTEINEFFIFEAIHVYTVVTDESYKLYREMIIFVMWFTVMHRDLFLEDYLLTIEAIAKSIGFDLNCLEDKEFCLMAINNASK